MNNKLSDEDIKLLGIEGKSDNLDIFRRRNKLYFVSKNQTNFVCVVQDNLGLSNNNASLTLDNKHYDAVISWLNSDVHIQDSLGMIDDSQREYLISGMTDADFNDSFN